MINSKIWAITGRTRVGKTKVINTLHYRLLSHNIVIGGILTRDVKDNGKRIGIELLNISTGITNELANTRRKTGPRIGKYRVNLKNLDNVISKELESASSNAELIIIDMIGPMELYSRNFCDAIKSILNNDKKVLCAIQTKYNHPIIKDVRNSSKLELLDLNINHKVEVVDKIYNSIIEELKL